jgi:hypothetical protein
MIRGGARFAAREEERRARWCVSYPGDVAVVRTALGRAEGMLRACVCGNSSGLEALARV